MHLSKTKAVCSLIFWLTGLTAPNLQADILNFDSQPETEEGKIIDGLMSMESIQTGFAINGDSLQLRSKALNEAAITIGIQSAIKFRYSKINEQLESISSELDLFDFKPLLLQEKMMPPIIAEADGTYGLKEDGSATSSMMAFEIISDAKLVAAPPQWRDYLIQEFDVNTDLNAALKPKDDAEMAIWKQGLKNGWEEGIKLADRMSIENWNRLMRDYRGAIRFHRLAQQGVISMPLLATGDMAIHVEDKKLDINQRVFQITEHARYQANTDEWKALTDGQIESKAIRSIQQQ